MSVIGDSTRVTAGNSPTPRPWIGLYLSGPGPEGLAQFAGAAGWLPPGWRPRRAATVTACWCCPGCWPRTRAPRCSGGTCGWLGYAVRGWSLGRNLGPTREVLDRAARAPWRRLPSETGRPVSLIGWSLGGVYARELARQRPDLVRQVITLGSPFALTDSAAEPRAPRVPAPPPPARRGPRCPAASSGPEPLQVPSTAVYSRRTASWPGRPASSRKPACTRTSRSAAGTSASASTRPRSGWSQTGWRSGPAWRRRFRPPSRGCARSTPAADPPGATPDAATYRPGCRLPRAGNGQRHRPRRRGVHPGSPGGAGAADAGPADRGACRAAAAGPGAAPQAAGRAARARPAVLGRRPGLRHRVPHPRARAAAARLGRAARRAGRPAARPPAGPQPAAVGDLPDHRAGQAPGRGLHQDPSLPRSTARPAPSC